MKTADGNDKLGKNCLVVSRPVGIDGDGTCPPTCVFYGDGCYAEATENQYKNVRPASMQNLITEVGRIRAMIIDAIKRLKSIRWHERGDWFKNGELDTEYVDNVCSACESVIKSGYTLPDMWFYTHIYDSRLAALEKYMRVYASIHNADDEEVAEAAGFKRFAWCDSDQNIAPKRPRGKVKKEEWKKELPKFVIINGKKYVICPEIKNGREKVTCSGTKNSVACNWCIKGRGNVLFPCH